MPEEFIAYIGSMVGRPIEFYSCFISHSSKDQEFAERLYDDLQSNGVRCWFAPHDIQGGRKIHEQLDEAIRLHDKLLLILSERSMSSPWVKTRGGGDRVGADGKETRTDGDHPASETYGSGELWRRHGKTPPEQTKLGWGTLKFLPYSEHRCARPGHPRWATRPSTCFGELSTTIEET